MAGPSLEHEKAPASDPQTEIRVNKADLGTPRTDAKAVLSRRAGSAATRLAALSPELNFGLQRAGTAATKDVPLILADEFVGAGVASPKITGVGMTGTSFTAAPANLTFNAHTRLQTLPVHFDPTTNGSHRAGLDLSVMWTDGRETKLNTSLVGEGQGAHSANTAQWEPTIANLDRAYEDVTSNRQGLFEKRAIGVREALGNMGVADSPKMSEIIVSALSTAALGLASGYITGAVVARLAKRVDGIVAEATQAGIKGIEALSEGAKNGFQTALDDGGKEAAVAVKGYVQDKLAGGGKSRVAFFASQEEALVDVKTGDSKRGSALKASAKNGIEQGPEESRPGLLRHQIALANAMAESLQSELAEARGIQYRASLTRWMVALAKDEFVESSRPDQPGTDLDDAVDVSPTDHLMKPKQGVISVSFHAKRQRPLGGTTKITGMTEAAFGPLKSDSRLRVRDLRMPIVASGYLAAGADVFISNNEIAFGKNEDGTVFWKGHDDALDVLQDLTNAPTIEEAVRVVIREDIEPRRLEHVETES